MRTEVSKLHQSTIIALMDKVLGALESLIEQFTGEDLRYNVIKKQRDK